MSNELVDFVRPRDLTRLNGVLTTNELMPSNSLAGVRMTKADTSGFTFEVVIPANLTMGTGLTFVLTVVDDGSFSTNDLGKAVHLGITPKVIADNTDNLDIGTAAAAETLATGVLSNTAGVVRLVPVPVTALDSAVVGSTLLVRVRRLGTDAADTCGSTIILMGIRIYNT